MEIACLDLEGVLIPEVWINFAERTGIEALRITTREMPDYDKLMKQRLKILADKKLGIRDIQDALQNVAYHLGARKDKPFFPRFDYGEKAEYLALIWGTTVMILTGLILWFPTIATRHLPAWSFPVSEVVHYYEAWLAFLAIVVWHLYFVIANPEVYPLNLTFMDGKAPEHHLLEKHGHLEGEGAGSHGANQNSGAPRTPADQPTKDEDSLTSTASK